MTRHCVRMIFVEFCVVWFDRSLYLYASSASMGRVLVSLCDEDLLSVSRSSRPESARSRHRADRYGVTWKRPRWRKPRRS
jgi:hypothetical protein